MPRWKKLIEPKVEEHVQCSVEGCTCQAEVSTKIPLDNMPTGLHVQVSGPTTTICSYHYHHIYNNQHQMVCKICGAEAKVGETFKWHCPNPPLMEEYLRATQGFSGILTKSDKICSNCHAKYTELVETLEVFGLGTIQSEEIKESEAPVSLDSDLDSLTMELKIKAQILECGTEMSSLTSTVLLVAETIRNQRAIFQ